ncbi:hypothetical protein RRG08_014476, partial [Elysia crispata]
ITEMKTLLFSELLRPITLCCVLVFNGNQLMSTGATIVLQSFQKSTAEKLGAARLGSPWNSQSLAACVSRCMIEYSTACKSVMYHANLRLCTPGSQVSFDLSPPDDAAEGDLYCPELACNTSDGFTLESGFGFMVCIRLLDSETFAQQRIECSSLGGFLASARAMEKLNLLQNFSSGATSLMGLDDQTTEGTFIWHDTGLPLTASEQGVLFIPGEPNNYGGDEDCVINNFNSRLNDIPCYFRYPAICERPMT